MTDQNEAPEWARLLMEQLDMLNQQMKGLQELQEQQNQQQPAKFSLSNAIADWLKEKEAAQDLEKRMDEIYNRRREVDARGWPVVRPEKEYPAELLEKAQEVAKEKRKRVAIIMESGWGREEPEE